MARGATAGLELGEWAPEQRAANVTKSEAARSLTIAILHSIITGYTQARPALLKPLKDYRNSLEEPAHLLQRRVRYDDPAHIRRSRSCADDPAITSIVMASVGDAAPFMPTAWRSYAASGRSAVGAETMSSAACIAGPGLRLAGV